MQDLLTPTNQTNRTPYPGPFGQIDSEPPAHFTDICPVKASHILMPLVLKGNFKYTIYNHTRHNGICPYPAIWVKSKLLASKQQEVYFRVNTHNARWGIFLALQWVLDQPICEENKRMVRTIQKEILFAD